MPQPLSRISPDATVTLWPSVDSRVVYVLASSIIALSAQVDHELSLLLVRIIGADARPALAMFDELDSPRAQLRLLGAAARAHLGPGTKQHRVFKAVLKSAEVAQAERHKVAHWIWGHCPELPGALLLADPRAVRTQTIELTRMLEKRKNALVYVLQTDDEQGKQDDIALSKLYAADKESILVYRDGDLSRSIRDLSEALTALHYFRYFLNPIAVNKLAPSNPELVDLETSEGALRRLNSLRLFREAYGPEIDSNDPSTIPPSAS
jgi:hypothetical protein